MGTGLSHFDAAGKAVMVDVSQKVETVRRAVASGKISMNAAAFEAVCKGKASKGDVLGVARIAGIMATKQTAHLIPLCHPVATEKAEIEFAYLPKEKTIKAMCTVITSGKTGVEMEALTGVTITLLTIYDMCKAVDKGMQMFDIRLEEKQGGKSGQYVRETKEEWYERPL